MRNDDKGPSFWDLPNEYQCVNCEAFVSRPGDDLCVTCYLIEQSYKEAQDV
jgi:hypothetical protein